MFRPLLQQFAALSMLGIVTACGGGTAKPFIPIPTPSPTPSPTPAPGSVALSTPSLTFIAIGASSAQSVTVSQANYTGTFTASTTSCGGIATIAPASGTTFSVTPIAAGACTFTITGGAGASALLTIGITTTSIGGS